MTRITCEVWTVSWRVLGRNDGQTRASHIDKDPTHRHRRGIHYAWTYELWPVTASHGLQWAFTMRSLYNVCGIPFETSTYCVDIYLFVQASICYVAYLWSLGEQAKPQAVGLAFTTLHYEWENELKQIAYLEFCHVDHCIFWSGSKEPTPAFGINLISFILFIRHHYTRYKQVCSSVLLRFKIQ